MENYEIKIPENYYISEYSTQWMVQISFKGERNWKYFPFKKYGGKENAFHSAIEFRDNFVKENNIDLNKRFKKSKTPGVQRTYDKINDTYYWQTEWLENGRQRAKRFSCKIHGDKAKKKAQEYREKIQKLIRESGQTLFEKPNPKTKIWRYMDFTKFVFMLER